MSSLVEQIKDRLNIVDVVTSYLKLEKAGSNYRARCPFHSEKTPSFFVSPTRDTYHCFGCDRGGDIFSFVEEMEGLDFRGALKILAERANVSLQYESEEDREGRERLYKVIEEATTYYQVNLTRNKNALAYLYGRGLKAETLKEFRVGFAHDEWRSLYNHLLQKGFSEREMEDAGLLVKSEKGYYDRFRSRIMFPISDNAGRIIAFSGRFLGEKDESDAPTVPAKYINSPDTVLFHKSRILFPFYKAKDGMRKNDCALLVEGQMDVLLSFQSGVSYTVATSGTAITEHHLTLIKRFTPNIIMAFDMDDAGITALQKGARLSLSLGMNVRALLLPKGMDPADFIQENGEDEWTRIVKDAPHVVSYFLKVLSDKNQDKREFRTNVSRHILPLVKQISNKIDQAHFVSEISKTIDIPEDPIWEELNKLEKVVPQTQTDIPQPRLARTDFSSDRKKKIKEQIVGILLWQENLKKKNVDISNTKKQLRNILGNEEFTKCIEEAEKNNKLIFETEELFKNVKNLQDALNELLLNLEKESLKQEFARLTALLKEAEEKGDNDKSTKILEECQEIAKKIGSL